MKTIKETNMDKVKNIATVFLYVDIAETRVPFVASHPFTNTWHSMNPQTKELIDLHNEVDASAWREGVKEEIGKSDLLHLFMLMNPPYILNFLAFVEDYLSDADLGYVLGNFWTQIEQISLDDSVTGKQIVEWFTRADKKFLMDEEERKHYEELPDMVTIYRGVTDYNKSRKKAFSWTTERKVAEWFAGRYNTGGGEVWKLIVPKERILCCFDGRNEAECVVNLYGFNEKPKVEKGIVRYVIKAEKKDTMRRYVLREVDGGCSQYLWSVTGNKEKAEKAEQWCLTAEVGSVYVDDEFTIEVVRDIE